MLDNYMKMIKDDKLFVSVGEAARLTGMEAQAVRKLVDKGTLTCYLTPSGQRLIKM